MPDGVSTPNLPLAGGPLSHVLGNEDLGGGQHGTRRRPVADHAADLAAYIAAAGIRWKFDSSTTTNADPGAGDIRLNHASLASVTELSISDLSAAPGQPNSSAWVLSWDDVGVAPFGMLYIKKAGAEQNFAIYSVTALNDQSGYTRVTVAHVGSAGSFINADALSVLFVPSAAPMAGLVAPGGRLTTQSGVGVMTTTQAAKTTLFYTPIIHRFMPLFTGTGFRTVDILAELSQATTDTTKSPAACLPESCYDVFGWDDASTIRATRGFVWNYSATITMTIASPCVVSWAGHGLREGAPFIPTTTGALPTGLTAGTTYYIGRSPGANTFNLATTPANAAAGTFINTTGSQSGTHTGTNRDTRRGTGAGTTELDFLTALGMPTNKFAVTNGPAANRGTYLGTIRTNAAAQIDWLLPAAAAPGGSPVVLSVWNMYNRRPIAGTSMESDNSWAVSSTSFERFNSSLGNSISFVRGLDEDALSAFGFGFCSQSNVQYGAIALGLGATNTPWDGRNLRHPAVTGVSASNGLYTSAMGCAGLGYNYLQLLQVMAGAGSVTFYGDNGSPTAQQSGLQFLMPM